MSPLSLSLPSSPPFSNSASKISVDLKQNVTNKYYKQSVHCIITHSNNKISNRIHSIMKKKKSLYTPSLSKSRVALATSNSFSVFSNLDCICQLLSQIFSFYIQSSYFPHHLHSQCCQVHLQFPSADCLIQHRILHKTQKNSKYTSTKQITQMLV